MANRITVRLNPGDVENLKVVGAALNPDGRSFVDKADAIRTGLEAAATLAREGELNAVIRAGKSAKRAQ